TARKARDLAALRGLADGSDRDRHGDSSDGTAWGVRHYPLAVPAKRGTTWSDRPVRTVPESGHEGGHGLVERGRVTVDVGRRRRGAHERHVVERRHQHTPIH